MSNSDYVRSLNEEDRSVYLVKLKELDLFHLDDDPFLLKVEDWSLSVESWPEVEFGNIVVYFLGCSDRNYSLISLALYKSHEAYKCFLDGCVHNLSIRHCGRGKCVIRGRVNSNTKSHDRPEDSHTAWVGVAVADGSIITGHCTCMTSIKPVCSHVAAILFKIEAVVRLGYREKASSLCQCQSDIRTVYEIEQLQKQKIAAAKLELIEKDRMEVWSGFHAETSSMQEESKKASLFASRPDECTQPLVETKAPKKSRDLSNESLSCSICQLEFTSRRLLGVHMERKHSNDDSVESGSDATQNETQVSMETFTASGRKSVPCHVCGKCFRNTCDLNRHVRIHTGEKPFSCDHCGKKFSETGSLHRHMRIHTGEKPYECKECRRGFTDSSNLRSHVKAHQKGTLLRCGECNECFNATHYKQHIKRHVKENHSKVSGSDVHACPECDLTFTSVHLLESHKEREHSGKDSFSPVKSEDEISNSNNEESPPEIISTPAGKKVQCNVCSKYFRSGRDLTRHSRVHTGEKPYMCNVCGKRFPETGSLYRHMKTHSGEKPCVCKKCGKTFGDRSHLQAHSKSHLGEKRFKCLQCDRRFINSAHQKQHMRSHTGEKPFVCTQCNKGFSTNSYLLIHMRRHTGERPYLCSQCAKSFSNSSDLSRHMKTHVLEKPYSCSVCNRKFIDLHCLHKHMRKHTEKRPFDCSVCGKGFFQKSVLQSHMRVHTGEKPYKCDVCGKGFAQSGDCHRHMRTHTGERPFECGECDKSFCDNSSYRKHIKIHARNRMKNHGDSNQLDVMKQQVGVLGV